MTHNDDDWISDHQAQTEKAERAECAHSNFAHSMHQPIVALGWDTNHNPCWRAFCDACSHKARDYVYPFLYCRWYGCRYMGNRSMTTTCPICKLRTLITWNNHLTSHGNPVLRREFCGGSDLKTNARR